MRDVNASAASRVVRPFSTSRAIDFAIDARPRSTAPRIESASTTRCPAAAATCAIPVPIAPAPTTPTTVLASSAINGR